VVAIIRYQNSCKIAEEDDEEILGALDTELSFKLLGAEFSKAYKGYTNDLGEFVTWDGKRHLLSASGKFPVGLLPRVMDFYAAKNIRPMIIDERPPLEKPIPIDISKKLEMIGKNPRSYQIEAANIACSTDRGIIRMATGAGKTLCAALITAKIGKPATILVIGKDLLYQLKDFFSKIFDEPIGIIGDGLCDIKDINIATIWSVGQALGLSGKLTLDDEEYQERKIDPEKFSKIKGMLLNSGTIILDECHLAACDTVQVIARNIKAEYVYGMSASPWRDDGADMLIEAFLGRKIVDISARELIRQGYLVRPNIRFIAPAPYPFKSGKYPSIYSKYIVENDQRNSMILKATKNMVEQGFVPLVLFHTIKHGDVLFDHMKKTVPTGLLSGKDSAKQREKIKDELESGKIKCLVASKIFEIGVDLPILSGLVIAGAGKSSVRALQRIGRVIRPYKGKKMSAIIDFADQAPYLNQHAEIRREIYESEFDVTWPQEKKQ
jgi:superfamily II DNA or RNA helicase